MVRWLERSAPAAVSGVGLLATAFLVSGLGACSADPEPRTQVMAVVELASNLPASALTPVDIEVFAGAADDPRPAWLRVHTARFPARDLPVELAIVPAEGDASRRYEVRVTTSDRLAGEDLLVAVRSGFVPEQTLALEVVLRPSCAERTGGCVTNLPPESLPAYGVTPGGTLDAGPGPGRDGGGTTPDDGGAGGVDGGSEECRFDLGCPGSADGCQRGVCVDGRCELAPNQGADCDDGDVCTVEDRCDAGGSCKGEPACGSNETCAAGADDMPVCRCAEGAVRCDGVCRVGICCPGAAGGECAACGTKVCAADGSRYDCVPPPIPPACTNPGGIHCTGSGPDCGCALSCQRRNCNDDCSIGGCFPSTC